jgi:hypothetical protein
MAESIDARLVAALSGIAPIWNSVKEDVESDPANESEVYYTFQYTTRGTLYADDEPTVEIASVMLHLWAPLKQNMTSLIRQTKAAVHEAGFTWPEKVDASDDKGRHIVFEFQNVDGVDADGDL